MHANCRNSFSPSSYEYYPTPLRVGNFLPTFIGCGQILYHQHPLANTQFFDNNRNYCNFPSGRHNNHQIQQPSKHKFQSFSNMTEMSRVVCNKKMANGMSTSTRYPNFNKNSSSNDRNCNKVLGGIRNFVNGCRYPKLNCDSYDRHSLKNRYNFASGKHERNNTNNSRISSPKFEEPHHQANSFIFNINMVFESSTNNKTKPSDNKESEIIAIFTSEDFPELPVPRKNKYWVQPKSNPDYKPVCSLNSSKKGNSNKTPVNLTSKQYFNNQTTESNIEENFVILSNSPPKGNSLTGRKKCTPNIRVRQISECSDDSFVICFEDGMEDGLIEFSELSSDDDYDSNDDKGRKNVKSNSHKTTSTESTNQFDSGFDEIKEKKVRFNLKPQVHVMYTWKFAYRAARKGQWENYALDRSRFKCRVDKLADILDPVLKSRHRENIYKERFL